MHLLSILIFIPLIGILLVGLIPSKYQKSYKIISAAIALFQVVLALHVYSSLEKNAIFQFVEKYNWIQLSLGNLGSLQIEYFVGMDGISAGLILLSSIVLFIASISSFEITSNLKGYHMLFNLLNLAIMGVFLSLDFFLFYVFYELMLLPLYFLIGMWGGVNREYASIKFFLYTLFGSVFMLLVMVGLYFSVTDPTTGAHTFNMLHMMDPKNFQLDGFFSPTAGNLLLGVSARFIAFIALFIGFAIKVPMVPFHTWLPDAHVEAPTPISIILAGVLLKVGAYGIIRICYGIFPDAAIHYTYYVALMGMISIIYGALNALSAKDLKRLIAYSSISHMGFVLIGVASLTSEGLNGALYQLFSHGILSAMLFFLVGVLYSRVHDRELANFRGLSIQMPRYTVFVVIAFFASLGLPGMSGFIGEAFSLFGAFLSESSNGLVPRWMAIVSTLGILLGAGYFLWALQRMFFGQKSFKLASWETDLTDLTFREYVVLIPLAIITIFLGVLPSYLFDWTNASVNVLINDTMLNGYLYLHEYFKF
jgi:NADH-quinone oxidoreductase subunit M